jgi:hypothetical protein
MRVVRAAAIAFVLPMMTAAAPAATPLELYAAGKYQSAISAGVGQNNGAGFAVAARATLAEALMRDAPCLECLKRAEGYARHAVTLDSNLPEGHIYLAAILGYEARIVGMLTARMHGFAEEAKAHIDAALAADPRNARALAALGGWNIAIVSNGGPTLARLLYGASVREGEKDFADAFHAAPGDVALRYQYALSLSGYDADGYRVAIADSLARAIGGKPATAYDSVMQTRAADLLRLLKAGDLKEYLRLVRRYQGYPATDAAASAR